MTHVTQQTIYPSKTTTFEPGSTSSSSPKTFLLTFSSAEGFMKAGILTIPVNINATLNFAYQVTGQSPRKVAIRRNGRKVGRFVVHLSKSLISIERVQKSDSGLYQVVAKVGKYKTFSNFELLVLEDTTATSASSTTQLSLDLNITGTTTDYANRTPKASTRFPDTSSSGSSNNGAQTEGNQDIGINCSCGV